MKKLNKKMIGIGIIVIIMIAIVGVSLTKKKSSESEISITTLNKGELINSVNVSGTVKSAEEYNIYSKENLAVKEVRVEVGDQVKKGDILAVLDADSIKKDIEKTTLNIESNLKSMENESHTIQSNIAIEEKNLKSSQLALEKQRLTYETINKEYKSGSNADLSDAKSTLEGAEIEKNARQKDYENAKSLYEQDFISKSDYESSENNYKTAVISYTSAVENYDRAKKNFEKTYKQAQADLESAKNNYEIAAINLNAAKQKNTDSYTYTIEQQKVEESKLQNQENNATIIATDDGTITAVNVKIGQTPSGILFELEDTEHLVISTYIKEYDVASVVVGQKVIIKSDGTKEIAINGEVSSIAPTTRKDTGSATNEFATEVEVKDKNSGLKIGMEARMNIILDQKANVFYTSYDTVLTSEEGQKVIYAVDEKGTIKEIPVQTGMESDVYVEIQGDGLYEGMNIITNPSGYTPGEKIKMK
ncbi:MAG: transporter [Clostridia bacterium]|jgi:multidrug efflux pump subunit AcrA (membrane-fusion protein)|nr:transporter [Clostridia bacterium]